MMLLSTASEIERTFSKLLKKYKQVSFAVAWASDGFPGYQSLVEHQQKIRQAVVGIHFYQTDPAFIERFLKDERVVFVKQPNGVFHPKFYIFENSSDDWMCLLGSANFTRGTFNSNIEACVVFGPDEDGDGISKSRLNSNLEKYWSMGKRFDEQELEYYRSLNARARQKLRPFAGDFDSKKSAKPVLNTEVLMMSWSEFFQAVQADKYLGLNNRILVLAEARRLFEKYERFHLMPKEDRQGIAGFSRREDVHWASFGSMLGAGTFKNRVIENDINVSKALDAIPPAGEVMKQHYSEFVSAFVQAFPEGRGHGLATATRLLTMKRPDYFVCFDRANRDGLCKAFETALGHHDYERYWNSIVERILMA